MPLRALPPVLGLFLLVLCGCSVGNQIDVEDTTVFPAGRLTYDILKAVREKKAAKEQDPDNPDAPKKPAKAVQGSLVAELDLDFARGSSKETSGSEGLDFDGKNFPGPDSFDADYFIFRGTGMVRGGFWAKEWFGLEGFFGLSGWSLDLKINSGGMSGKNSSCSIGYILGAQLSLRPVQQLTLYGRASFSGAALFGDVDGVGSMTTLEAAAALRIIEHVSIFAGWRAWQLGESRTTASDIDLHLSGPFFGIELGF